MANKNPNMDGLKKYNERTTKEKQEFHSKGGKASAEKRRENASLREAAKMVLSLPIVDTHAKEQLKALGVDDESMNNAVLPILGLYKRACKGDSSAARLLAELNNENQVQGTTNIGAEGVNMHVTFTGKGGNNGENA